MAAKNFKQTCGACGGRGTTPTREVGAHLAAQREKYGITQRALADKLNISRSYLSDLELDNRAWTNELVESYQQKLSELVEEAKEV